MRNAHDICNDYCVRRALLLAPLLCATAIAARAQSPEAATRALTSGEAIFHAGCAGCHGSDGRGASPEATQFDRPATFPDFTRCDQTTPEQDVDWKATIRQGGHGRGFSPIMPSFSEALSDEQIDAVIGYVRGLCRGRGWPRGELNLPRPLITEKAFPESETVFTTAVDTRHPSDATSTLGYEHRLGRLDQLELSVPFSVSHDSGAAARGFGDVTAGLKHVLFSSRDSIVSAQGEAIFPTGDQAKGLGSGVMVFEGFGAYGQILPGLAFVQAQAGIELPTDTVEAPQAVYGHFAFGKSFRAEDGVGRLWSPMLELIVDRDLEDEAKTNVDLLPQFQVTINRRQHVRANVGVQFPVAGEADRPKRLVFYLLWDWFDGGLLEGWR
jgi:mono/diheme cytochrome c family protein